MYEDKGITWPDQGLLASLNLLKPMALSELIMVDVGAHRGESLKAFSENWNGNFKYVGIEPNPDAYSDLLLLASTIQTQNRSISCLPMAASNKDGFVHFMITNASAVAGVLEPLNGLNDRVPSGDHKITQEVDVEAISINSLLDRQDIDKVDILKIDTEGYDLEVLKGSLNILKSESVLTVLTEVFFVPYRVGQAFFWDIASFMSREGYHFVNLYDTRNTSQGRLYTGNGLWVSPQVAQVNGFL